MERKIIKKKVWKVKHELYPKADPRVVSVRKRRAEYMISLNADVNNITEILILSHCQPVSFGNWAENISIELGPQVGDLVSLEFFGLEAYANTV